MLLTIHSCYKQFTPVIALKQKMIIFITTQSARATQLFILNIVVLRICKINEATKLIYYVQQYDS